ncbi:MAG: hypothetical protein V4591_10410 [Bdellovibrionota bacterium]
MNVQFRIFDEEQSGAFVDLEENKKYRVGNSMEHDIYVSSSQDQQIGLSYFDFSIDGSVISFFQSNGKVTYIDFMNHTQNFINSEYAYEIPCLFEFNGVKFSLCDTQDSWEKWFTILQSLEQPKNQFADENPQMSEEEMVELDKMYPQQGETSQKISSSILQKASNFLKGNNLMPSFKLNFTPKNKKFITLVCVGVFLGLMLLLAFSAVQKYSLQHMLKNQQATSLSDIQAIKQIEVNLPTRFSNLKFISNLSDMVVIIGVVKNQEDIAYIQKRFEKFKKIVTFKLITADEAIRKLNLILKAQKVPLLTTGFNDTTYRLYLSGLLASMDAINDIELAVSNQVSEVSDLDTTQVFSLSDVDKDVEELLAGNGLGNRLTVKKHLNDRKVYIGGYLSQSEITELRSHVSDLMTKYQNLIKITLDVKDAAASLPFKIVAVNTSGFPSFMTNDGQKVFEGGEIDGMKVDKISPTEIIFSGKFPLVYKLDDSGFTK